MVEVEAVETTISGEMVEMVSLVAAVEVQELVDLELASNAMKKATNLMNVLLAVMLVVVAAAIEPALNVVKKATCLENALKLELEEVELALNVEKMAISQENALQAEVVVVTEVLKNATNAKKRVISREIAQLLETLEVAIEPVSSVEKKVTFQENVLQLVVVIEVL